MKKKLRVGVIFGGTSSEYEVSLVSATSIIRNLDLQRYEVVPIGITKQGQWITGPNILESLKQGIRLSETPALLRADQTSGSLVSLPPNAVATSQTLDVIFPVVHGPFGEDGTLQGLLEMANIPYVGCGVLASALAMDKAIFKQLMQSIGIPTARSVTCTEEAWNKNSDEILRRVNHWKGSLFVKPANNGSSVGISKVDDRSTLDHAIREAFRYDVNILIEQAVPHAREIEIGVLGGVELQCSVPGEIIPSNAFYDYDAKYVDGKSKEIIPAEIPENTRKDIERFALNAFRAIDGWGMARVDFLLSKDDNTLVLSELNTIPGFTSISMYAKLFEASGVPYPELLERLIQLAIMAHPRRRRRATLYQPRSAWFHD